MLNLLYLFLLVDIIVTDELPPFLKVCHKNEANMEKCIIDAVENFRPYLISGVPESNIPGIEPLILENLINENAIGLHIETNNVRAYGCSNFTIESLIIDHADEIYEFNLTIPLLKIDATYKVDGKILVLPIKGDGDFNANINEYLKGHIKSFVNFNGQTFISEKVDSFHTEDSSCLNIFEANCRSQCKLKAEIYEKDGEQRVRYLWLTLSSQVGGGNVVLDNLFGGNKVLGGIVNGIINKNLQMFLKELLPVIEKALSKKFLDIGNKIVEPYTYDQLFPE